jgi:eukaryotic-like serine/threonine-protein kinase
MSTPVKGRRPEEYMAKKPSRTHHGRVLPGEESKEAKLAEDDAGKETAVPNDDDESSWEELGSTRIVGADESAAVKPGRAAVPEEGASLGDFQLIKKLGEGAMGAVFKAHQLSFDRDVALKILFPHVANNPKLVARLQREGRVMGQLDHPNIVQAYAVDECQGCHFVAMELVDGQSMQKWLSRVGRLTPGDAVHVILACCSALKYAHQQGMIHRDIKPDNILLTRSGTVKVADLGMVKTDDEEMHLTQTGHAVGTPWYMPLEQARNAKNIDGRSDIYALGCTLYCLLVGHPPFTGQTIVEVIQAKERGVFEPARKFNGEVPSRLDDILAKMVQKDLKYRYQSMDEVIRDLEGLGISSERLAFVAGKGASQVRPASTTVGLSSGDRTVVTDEGDPNLWYVLFKTADGKETPRKYTTTQIERMLTDGTVSASAKVSHTLTGTYRSLATYKEFHSTALTKLTKKGADKNAHRARSLYKQIEEKERQREVRDQDREEAQQHMDLAKQWGTIALVLGGALVGIVIVGCLLYGIANMFK